MTTRRNTSNKNTTAFMTHLTKQNYVLVRKLAKKNNVTLKTLVNALIAKNKTFSVTNACRTK